MREGLSNFMRSVKSSTGFIKVDNRDKKTLRQLVKGFNLYLGVTKFNYKAICFSVISLRRLIKP